MSAVKSPVQKTALTQIISSGIDNIFSPGQQRRVTEWIQNESNVKDERMATDVCLSWMIV